MSLRIEFLSFTLDTVTRTPITIPENCQGVRLRNLGADCTLFDAASGGNSSLFPGGGERDVLDLPDRQRGRDQAAGAGTTTLCWATAASGTGPIEAEYRYA